jgi:hypothetical protein
MAIIAGPRMDNGAFAVFAHQGRLTFVFGDDFPSFHPHLGAFGAAFPAELERRRVPLISLNLVWRNEDTRIIARQISTASELSRSTL